MRILMLTNLYPNALQPHRANYNRQQMRLVAKKMGVSVIAPIAWTDELAARAKGHRIGSDRCSVSDGIPVEHPKYWFTPKFGRVQYGRFYYWSVRKTFRRLVREFAPELIYAPWAYPDGWAAVRLGREKGLPVVIKVVGSDFLMLSTHPEKQHGTLEALRGADAIVAVSRDLANRMAAHGIDAQKISIVYDGVDTTLFRPGSKSEARARLGMPDGLPTLLFVGNLVPVKAIDNLIDACALLANRGLQFHCLLVGEGPLRHRLEQQARRRGLAERIRFVGPVANDLLPDWYRAADVLVLPSHSEGVPNVLLEAAACGTPFVASRVGGIPEIAHLGVCRLVPPASPDLLADSVASILEGPRDRPAVESARPRSRAESADELIEVFEGVLARHCGQLSPFRSVLKQEEAPCY
jgi:glycosyltransferase involved in cell wall biosynthesis